MSSNPSWLKEPKTKVSTNNNGTPDWAVDVESPSPSSSNKKNNNLHAVTVGTETAAPPSLTPVNTGGSNREKSAQETAAETSWGDYFSGIFERDGKLLLITILIIIVMNIPYVKWVMYPFKIFSTWIHEFCHGMAALLAGGKIVQLEIFPDTSGLATTAVVGNRRGFVASAGYQGTAVTGCLLLVLRRTKRGPRGGTMALAITMIFSVLLWVRNAFGICFVLLLGFILAAVAWKCPSNWMRYVYVFLAVTTCLNAITSVQDLFGANHVVNGSAAGGTDAHTMAEIKGGTHTLWAMLWLILAIILTVMGFLFAIPGPDEVADFTCCGVCQDLGLFRCCNAPGQRIIRRMYRASTNGGGNSGGGDGNNNS